MKTGITFFDLSPSVPPLVFLSWPGGGYRKIKRPKNGMSGYVGYTTPMNPIINKGALLGYPALRCC